MTSSVDEQYMVRHLKNLLISSLLFSSSPAIAETIPMLIEHKQPALFASSSSEGTELWRSLSKLKTDPKKNRIFWFNPKNGVRYKGLRKKFQTKGGDSTSTGNLRKLGSKKPLGTFIISTSQNDKRRGTSAYFVTGDGRTFEMSGENNQTWLKETDESKQPGCPVSLSGDHAIELPQQVQADPPQVASTDTLKVLVVYTTSAKNAIGGANAMLSQINTMVAYANTSYVNSGIDMTLTLAGTRELDTDETGYDFETILNHLTNSDGVWDEALQWRNDFGADFISVIVANNAYCGLGWLMTSGSISSAFCPYMITATNYSCVSSFAHELGHNLGAHHDSANASGQGAYAYSYGWRWTGNSAQQWRSVMAYAPGTRIGYFSNPNVNYDGVATGSSGVADNATTLNNTKSTGAACRADPAQTPTPTWTPGGPTATPTNTPTATPVTPEATPTPVATATSGGGGSGLPSETPTPDLSGDPYIVSLKLKCGERDRRITGTLKIGNATGPVSDQLVTFMRANQTLKMALTNSKGEITVKFKNNKTSSVIARLNKNAKQKSVRCKKYRG